MEHDKPPIIHLLNNRMIEFRVRPGTCRDGRQNLLNRWYRQQLKELLPPMIAKWEQIIAVSVSEWRIRKMKTKWGTCNIAAKRICLNLELPKKPRLLIEYVLVHEMVHLLERLHNDRFVDLMDRFMPNWRLYRDELNSLALADENWDY